MPLKFDIRVDDKGNPAITKIGTGVKNLDDRTKKLGDTFNKVFGGLIALKTLQQAWRGIKDVTEAYLVQERAEKTLAAAMKERGTYSDAAFQHNKNLAASLQKLTTFGDEEILAVQKQLTQYGLYGKALDDATKASLDFAAAKGVDLKTAGDLLGKTLASSTNALGRYGIEVKGAVGSSERLSDAMAGINKMWGGSAAAEADTYAGKLKQLQNQFGDIKEEIGKELVPALIVLADIAKKAMDALFPGKETMITSELELHKQVLSDLNKQLLQIPGSVDVFTGKFIPATEEANAQYEQLQRRIRLIKTDIENLSKTKVDPGGILGDGLPGDELKKIDPTSITGTDPFAKKSKVDLAMERQAELQKARLLEIETINQIIEAEEFKDAADEIRHKKKIERLKKEKEMAFTGAQETINNALQLANMFKDNNREMFEFAKALAIAQAAMNTYQSATKALADYGPIAGPILAATSLALGMAQVSKIAATEFKARHGAIVGGYGNHTSDSEVAHVSRGERILSVEEVQHLGGMQRIQESIESGFNKGGGAQIVIQGNVIGEEQYVRRTILPLIAREATR